MKVSPHEDQVIFVIAGRTGAGKSTVSDYMSNAYNLRLLSFAEMGKQYSLLRGFDRLRDCYAAFDRDMFKTSLSQFMRSYIRQQSIDSPSLVIDGLYAWDVVADLRVDYRLIVIYISVSEDIRYDRISARLGVSKSEAAKENELKERIKKTLGSEKLLSNADFIVNGDLGLDAVKESIDSLMRKFDTDTRGKYEDTV